jgi:hypothetical protein
LYVIMDLCTASCEKDVKAMETRKLNLLKSLSHTSWGSDQRILLRIHQMIVLSVSTLRYWEEAYGSASCTILRQLDAVHHKSVRLALGTFAICRTENLLCEVFRNLTCWEKTKYGVVRSNKQLRIYEKCLSLSVKNTNFTNRFQKTEWIYLCLFLLENFQRRRRKRERERETYKVWEKEKDI